jgi:hypothetical protein
MIRTMSEIAVLMDRVAARAASEETNLPARATSAMSARAEGQLGFALHPLLARLYTDVADGGFGPDYKLFPLLGPGRNVVDQYSSLIAESAGGEYPLADRFVAGARLGLCDVRGSRLSRRGGPGPPT